MLRDAYCGKADLKNKDNSVLVAGIVLAGAGEEAIGAGRMVGDNEGVRYIL